MDFATSHSRVRLKIEHQQSSCFPFETNQNGAFLEQHAAMCRGQTRHVGHGSGSRKIRWVRIYFGSVFFVFSLFDLFSFFVRPANFSMGFMTIPISL